ECFAWGTLYQIFLERAGFYDGGTGFVETLLTTQSGGVWEIQTAFSRRPAGPAAPWALACHPVCCPSPPVRPAARRRAGLRHCRWCWTGAAAWGRVGPQGCPGATAAERATGKA